MTVLMTMDPFSDTTTDDGPPTREDMRLYDLCSAKLSREDFLKCLRLEADVILPTPNAKPCNNLQEYLYRSTRGSRTSQGSTSINSTTQDTAAGSSKQQPSSSRRTQSEPFAVPLVRNFDRILKKTDDLLGDCPGLVTPRRKQQPDVFSRVNQIQSASGPINVLKDRLNQYIKVLIRRRRKVPYISRVIEYKGELILFDKHMNLLMKDVIESFKYSLDGKIHKRARHRDSLFIRGDNIILVT